MTGIIVERSRMIKRLLGGMNFIEYSGDKPMMTLLRHDYKAPVCKVHVVMRDCFGNKLVDTTTIETNWKYYVDNNIKEVKAKDAKALVDLHLFNEAHRREGMPIELDNKTYVNVKIISMEIIDEWTEDAYWLEEVVSPQQD